MRLKGRRAEQLRDIKLTPQVNKHAEGSVLVEFGDTRVICTASVNKGVPHFLRGSGSGWITAEYAMLPRATSSRTMREVTRGKQSGRSAEIQRLIGRSVRSMLDLKTFGEYTFTLDCDVIQADGGTRTAAITGAAVALIQALNYCQQQKIGKHFTLHHMVAAISVGIHQGQVVLDLDYPEDAAAETDMNIVMDSNDKFVEIQGTAEGANFNEVQLISMLQLAKSGIRKLISIQKQVLRDDDLSIALP